MASQALDLLATVVLYSVSGVIASIAAAVMIVIIKAGLAAEIGKKKP